MGLENRRDPRAPLELRVEYRRMNTFFADYTKNISRGGTFIRTASPLPLGTRLSFVLDVPCVEDPLVLEGEVVRSVDAAQAGAQGAEAGMGVRFLFEDDEERTDFERTVEDLMVRTLGEDIYRQLVKPAAGA
jgi:type IV pilus assembly protein PilZ